MTLPSSRVYAVVLAFVRIVTGAMWLVHGVPKFTRSDAFMPPNGVFASYLQNGLAKAGGPYHAFLAGVVAPNANLFAELVRLGEVLTGMVLVLGLFTRLGGLVGVLLPLNYMAARGALESASGWGTVDASLALLSAISLLLPTGRVLGLDGLFRRRAPRPVPVVAEFVPEPPLDGPTASR